MPPHLARPRDNRGRASLIAATVALSLGTLPARADLGSLDLRLHDSDLTPAITLSEEDNRTVEEYRVNGNLYMVKITPSIGAPYYLIDQDGSGDMGLHRGGSDLNIQIPQWALLSW